MARRGPVEEKDSYCIFPRTPGVTRQVGQFEFSCVSREPRLIVYSWRYLPEPGEPGSHYIDNSSNRHYNASSQPLDYSKSQRAEEYTYGWRHHWANSRSLVLSYRIPDGIRAKLEKAIDADHKIWKKARAVERTLADKTAAEGLGITITEYRRQKAASRKAEKTINATSAEMEISMFLVSLRDNVDAVLSALKHRRAAYETLYSLRSKIYKFSGATWVKAKTVARQCDNNKKK